MVKSDGHDWPDSFSRIGKQISSVTRACRFAGLTGLRVHDLRHSFASVAVTGGHGLPVVGKALGHKRASTTERYSHLGAGVVREMVEETGAHIADRMTRKDGRS